MPFPFADRDDLGDAAAPSARTSHVPTSPKTPGRWSVLRERGPSGRKRPAFGWPYLLSLLAIIPSVGLLAFA